MKAGKKSLLLLLQEFLYRSDEEHPMNASDFAEHMRAMGYECDRRTFYADCALLEELGLDLIQAEDPRKGWYVGSRDFELAELKLLVDAVGSSRFITPRKSKELVRKLSYLTSESRRPELERPIRTENHAKAANEAILYNVDRIHDALRQNLQLSFSYVHWTVSKTLESVHAGRAYRVSPWELSWNDGNYYLIAFDEDAARIKHFRVDKMKGVDLLDAPRNGQDAIRGFDLAAYVSKTFGMFGSSEEAVVEFRCENELAGVMLDRFGTEVWLVPEGDRHFRMKVPLFISPQFFGWAAGFGNRLEILSPGSVRDAYRQHLEETLSVYREDGRLPSP